MNNSQVAGPDLSLTMSRESSLEFVNALLQRETALFSRPYFYEGALVP